MSWSVAASGKQHEVISSVMSQFNSQKCEEPEESIRKAAGNLIVLALQAQDPDKNVQVSAWGSQSVTGTVVRNSLSIKIDPQG